MKTAGASGLTCLPCSNAVQKAPKQAGCSIEPDCIAVVRPPNVPKGIGEVLVLFWEIRNQRPVDDGQSSGYAPITDGAGRCDQAVRCAATI